MNELNFDDICLLAERIQEAVREIQDNGVLFDKSSVAVSLKVNPNELHSIDKELFTLTGNFNQNDYHVADVVNTKIFGISFNISAKEETQSE